MYIDRNHADRTTLALVAIGEIKNRQWLHRTEHESACAEAGAIQGAEDSRLQCGHAGSSEIQAIGPYSQLPSHRSSSRVEQHQRLLATVV
jgi:hypothetical protein